MPEAPPEVTDDVHVSVSRRRPSYVKHWTSLVRPVGVSEIDRMSPIALYV